MPPAPDLKPRRAFAGHRWTPEDDVRLMEMVDEGASHQEIAEEFEVTHGAVKARMEFIRFRNRGNKRINDRGDLNRRILDERDRRSALRDAQSITARFFGDPPAGYSALDKRGGK